VDLDEVLRSASIWRGRSGNPATSATLATGLAELDQALPGGGWPLGALIEIMLERHGLGELKLLMPALARLSREATDHGAHPQRWIVWVAPPFVPYAPALASYGLELNRQLWVHPQRSSIDDNSEVLWAMEQALRSGSSAAVLAWVKRTDNTVLRRLQLAAEEGSSLAVLFRPQSAMQEASPAALRLMLCRGEVGTDVEVLKCRGGYATTVRNVLPPSLS